MAINNSIKLLYVTNRIDGSGGLERVLSIKASYLADNFDYEIHVVTLSQGDKALFYNFSEKLIHHDITVRGYTLKAFSQYVKGLKKIARLVKPDVICVCDDGFKGFFVPLFLNKPCPMVYERHASKYISKNEDNSNFLKKIKRNFVHFMAQLGAHQYDKFVVLTENNLSEWTLKNMKVIPNPLSFYPEEKSTLKNKKVITVGNHGYQKGMDRLLKIWQISLSSNSNWQLEIYGKFDSDKKTFKLSKTLKIDDNITFFNPVKNIVDKYLDASIYAMPSRSEGFGMVLIEAMACGLPCVAFDCPSGPRDIIVEGKNGFLIENGNLEDFSEKLLLLMQDENLRRRMGENSKATALNYLPEKIVPQWDKLFKNLLTSAEK